MTGWDAPITITITFTDSSGTRITLHATNLDDAVDLIKNTPALIAAITTTPHNWANDPSHDCGGFDDCSCGRGDKITEGANDKC